MFAVKVSLLLLAQVAWSEGKINPHCGLCEDHTMCRFEEGQRGEACEGYSGSGVTEEEKTHILELHNWYRRVIASGQESRGLGGPQPAAANMMKLAWDNDLAVVAQRWADQCTFQHDTCRKDVRFGVGQNIHWNWRVPTLPSANWTAAIHDWYIEVTKHDPKLVPAYEFNPDTGHYTQMMWHDTHLVGCGRTSYGPNKMFVCNYGPNGNWVGEPMYTIGEPCSQCPQGSTCSESLCEAVPGKTVESNSIKTSLKTILEEPTKAPERTVFDLLTVPKTVASHVPAGPFKLSPTITLGNEGGGEPAPTDPPVEPSFVDFLTPPRVEAESVYEKIPLDAVGATVEVPTTSPEVGGEIEDVPINYNIIEDLENTDDEEIKKEIEELKLRIKNLVNKILAKRTAKPH